MFGSIIGDFAGSIYEYDEFKDSRNKIINLKRRLEILDKNRPLITEKHFLSDDTILTIAILDSILNEKSYSKTLREYGLKYGSEKLGRENYFDYMFSPDFIKWCKGLTEGKSCGSGAAMRVSPVGFLYNDLSTVRSEAIKSAKPTHNNLDAISSAQAVAVAINYLRREKETSDSPISISFEDDMKTILNSILDYNFYNPCSLEVMQRSNTFKRSGKAIVIDALNVIFDPSSDNFENCIRNAVSIGGDTDTIACIVGGIAEAKFGVPLDLRNQVVEYLPTDFFYLLQEGYKLVKIKK